MNKLITILLFLPIISFSVSGKGFNYSELKQINWESIAALIEFILITFLVIQIYIDRKKRKEAEQIVKLQFFSRFAERYQDIMILLPHNVYSKKFNYSSLDDKESFLRAMRSYFDLCSQEFFLYSQGKISEDVWSEWKSGIISSINCPAFKIAWKKLPKNRSTLTEFKNFINDLIKKDIEK